MSVDERTMSKDSDEKGALARAFCGCCCGDGAMNNHE